MTVTMLPQVPLLAALLLIACPRLTNGLRFNDVIDKDFSNMARLRLSDFSQIEQSIRNNPDFVRALIEAIRLKDAYGTNPASEAAAAAAVVQRGYDDIRQEDGEMMPDDASSSSSSASSSSALRTPEDSALVRRTGPSAKSRRGDVSVSQLAELLNTLKSRGTEEGGLPPLQSLRFG